MAINQRKQNITTTKFKISDSGDRYFFLLIILFGLLISGCSKSRLTQCQQIFRIARGVSDMSQDIDYSSDEQSEEIKSWLQAANTMDNAANNIQALHINNSELIKYQNKLVTIYRIYSQATYDAVKARENKSLEALAAARTDALEAGKMQQDLIQDLNNYCVNKK